jgi:hypothetical protein
LRCSMYTLQRTNRKNQVVAGSTGDFAMVFGQPSRLRLWLPVLALPLA